MHHNILRPAIKRSKAQLQLDTGRIHSTASALALQEHKELVNWDPQVLPSSCPCCTLQHKLLLPHGLCQTWQTERKREKGFPSDPYSQSVSGPYLHIRLNTPITPNQPHQHTHL